MKILPLVIIILILAGMFLFAQRAKQRAAGAESARRATIGLGSEVMTTSGLYGQVVAIDPDGDTVLLRIAPGIEVKWAFAALRDIASLPAQYRLGEQAVGEQATGSDPEPGTQAGTQTSD
ncbi:preprotein translocase YajC subunit [Jatrophihabitans sp. GAS493]|uniref:preprotein translocase subunit YajC n=1 Tax=Jatrophihabitans sp. GAS493 TaxID=1907575 RepID=UPI000BB96C5E|nr:preprotein translocase subunit YajC [Jatrophihabitans sp. GAS493]SOD74265.1 preprotein translocase YajC subunit [Jatrophihabitans sp. GAS493]